MFALEVEYLTGRAVATARHAREEAEWPPHPGRLFSALVNAAYETFSDDGLVLPTSIRDALEWLEALAPPAIAASEGQRRGVVTVFVPGNDAQAPELKKDKSPSAAQIDEAMAVLPERRGKQSRFFPATIPDSPLVHFIWEKSPDVERHRSALESLASAVVYLGHSSSTVRVAVVDTPAAATYEPDPTGRHTFRVPTHGRLRELESQFRRSARPSPGQYAAYRKTSEKLKPPVRGAGTVFGDVVVCELDREGPHLPLSGSLKLLTAVRDAIIERTDAESTAVKSLVSGHTANGDRSRDEHVAYIPLANVGYPYSDGRVMGFGVVLPRGLGRYSAERWAILRAVAGLPQVGIKGGHAWSVALSTEEGAKSLQTIPYIGPSKTWATATPLLCDRHPKDRDGERLEDVIADSVERVVGVRPVYVEAGPISRHRGVPPSHAFPNRRKDGDQPRHRAHAFLAFEHEISGPIIVCAGRYLGLGLFRVWEPEVRG